jgi:hypothetical protein
LIFAITYYFFTYYFLTLKTCAHSQQSYHIVVARRVDEVQGWLHRNVFRHGQAVGHFHICFSSPIAVEGAMHLHACMVVIGEQPFARQSMQACRCIAPSTAMGERNRCGNDLLPAHDEKHFGATSLALHPHVGQQQCGRIAASERKFLKLKSNR